MNTSEYDKLPIEAVKKVAPSVVSIVISKFLPKIKGVYGMPGTPFANPFLFGEVEDGQKEKISVGGGSGFIVHPDGLILTNKHVVFDQDAEYTVITTDLEEYPAKVISRDPINDIAVLKITPPADGTKLPAVVLGNSSKIELGQTVLAIGNALGMFSNIVSRGIISGLSRSISAALGTEGEMEHLRGVLQTDVAINQGNSGGPLINIDGEVVAINTAIIFGAQNIGFSIPINWAKQDLEDIIKYGRIVKPYLGLQYVKLDKKLQKQYSLPVDYGALVVRDHRPDSVAIVPNSPAARAGLQENDILLELNGEKISDELQDMLQKYSVETEVELTVLRKDQQVKVKVKLEERK